MRRAIVFASAALALLMPHAADAAFEITATPEGQSGNFEHNVFHSASGTTSGAILAYFNRDATQTSIYDPGSGNLTLYINIYSDEALSNLIGTGVGTSNDMLASNFNGHDGGTLGTIAWDFTMSVGGTGLFDTTTTFFDEDYGAQSNGMFSPNSLTGTTTNPESMTLWGANNAATDGTSTFINPELGVDLVMEFSDQMVVPAPPSLALVLLGLASCSLIPRRRRTSRSAE